MESRFHTPLTKEVWERAFEVLIGELESFAEQWREDPKLILTEADLQSWLFRRFSLALEEGDLPLHMHSNTPFISNNDQLTWYPDLVVFHHDEVSLDDREPFYQRKGFTGWGSSIAFELKFNRIKSVTNFESEWKNDIDKLANINRRHFADGREIFFGVFVLFSRKPISLDIKDEINSYADSKRINAKCFDMENFD